LQDIDNCVAYNSFLYAVL